MPCLPDYDSPAALNKFLEENGMAMQKKFGQNFLINRTCRERLVSSCAVSPGSTVWEIGPGLGAMTSMLVDSGVDLTVFEIDHGFAAALRSFFSDNSNFSLVEGDALKTWQKVHAEKGTPQCLFGNLPYNIAATLLAGFITSNVIFDTCVLTVQKEVAIRMGAAPGSKDYSSFSVLCQSAYTVKTIMDIAPGSFWPKPNVVSRAVKLTRKPEITAGPDPELFFSLIRALFASRRKTVYNNLKNYLAINRQTQYNDSLETVTKSILAQAGIDPSVRAETLALESFVEISKAVHTYEHKR